MKRVLKNLLTRLGLRLLREPAGIVMGHDLWRDLALLLATNPAPVCVDVGANRGEISAALLRLGPDVRVHAFEPSSQCQAALSTRFAHDPRFTLVGCGLGDEEVTREFHHYANDHLSSFLPLSGAAANPFKGELELVHDLVPLTTLNRYATQLGLKRIDLLKIDTQGYDLRVLHGAADLLQAGAIAHVLIELNFIPLYENQPAPAEIISFLAGHGLQLVDFYEKCRRGQRLAWCTALFRKADL